MERCPRSWEQAEGQRVGRTPSHTETVAFTKDKKFQRAPFLARITSARLIVWKEQCHSSEKSLLLIGT